MQRQVTLRDIWQIVWKRRLWLVLPIIVVTAVAIGGSYMLPVVYESSTKIVITNQKLVSRTLELMIPQEGMPDYPTARTEQRWLQATRSEITSTGYISKLITDLKLTPSPNLTKVANTMRSQFPEYAVSDIVRKLQIDDLRDRIEVKMVGENQISITCSSSDPKMAVDLATSIANIYRESKLADEIVEGREGQKFADQQLAIYKKEYEDAEKELADFKNSYLKTNLDNGISSSTNLAAVESEVDATKLELSEVNDRTNFLAAKVVDIGVDTSTAFSKSPDLKSPVEDALDLTKDISRLMTKYLWQDAKIQGQLKRLTEALGKLNDASIVRAKKLFPSISSSLQADVGEMIYRRNQAIFLSGKDRVLSDAIQQIKGIISGQPYYDQMVKKLEEKTDGKKKLYNTWLDNAEGNAIKAATTAAAAETKYRILEPASIPLEPSSPNRLKIAIMGLALGIILGVCATVVGEVVDHSVKSIEDIEELVGYEVVGTIPKIEEATRMKNVNAA